MKPEEITELVETRPNKRVEDDITLSRTHEIALPQGFSGELRIEYKPDEYRLTEEAFDDLAEAGFLTPTFEELGHEPVVEALVSDLYHALVDLLFPGSAYLGQPEQRLPLVVEIHYGKDDVSEYYASMGTYR